jgi:rhodanese-related sulfurtransferase
MLKPGEVFAFFDVREEGEFSIKGHPLFATPLPLSRLEPRAFALLPDPGTRIVLMDSGEESQDPQWAGRANRAAAKLSQLGYTSLAVMNGGLKAWREAGYEVFTGVNVPSKAFGEVVEHDNDTPRIDAADVQKLLDSKADMVILDSRPMPEFNNMSIPGGVDCPGAELVYRVKDFAPRPETLVVVNCAGRTRSIIGAQSLINAGLPNKVMALKNGTMGWHLAGLKVARGETKRSARREPKRRSSRKRQQPMSPNAWASGRSTCPASRRSRRKAVRSTSSMCAIRPNMRRATSGASAMPRAGSSCRQPINMSGRATPRSCCTTMTACAPP